MCECVRECVETERTERGEEECEGIEEGRLATGETAEEQAERVL